MGSLIDKLVHVEGEAGGLIEQARADAKKLEKETDAEIERIHKAIQDAVAERITAFRAEAAQRHETEAAHQQSIQDRALAAAEHVPVELISRQVDRIVARFQEM